MIKTSATDFELIQGDEDVRALLHPQTVLYLGTLNEQPCLTCEIDQEFVLPAGWSEQTQRTLFGRLDEQFQSLNGRVNS